MTLLFLLFLFFAVLTNASEDESKDEEEMNYDSMFFSIWDYLFGEGLESNSAKKNSDEDIEDVIETKDSTENSSTDKNLINEANNTVNKTQSRVKHICIPHLGCEPALNCTNLSLLKDPKMEGIINQREVVGVNLTQLQYLLENASTNSCVLVMFYAVWCTYSVEFAPIYNQLGRSFPQIPVVAMDFGSHSPDRYLLAYVPRVILYYSGRLVYDINTSLKHEELSHIISNMTGLSSHSILEEELDDINEKSPLPLAVVEDNMMLWISISGVIFILLVNVIKNSRLVEIFARFYERLSTLFVKRD